MKFIVTVLSTESSASRAFAKTSCPPLNMPDRRSKCALLPSATRSDRSHGASPMHLINSFTASIIIKIILECNLIGKTYLDSLA